MSSVHHLREFISARLTAAAEEIFSEFEKTIVQYEEMDRHRRLLDISWKPGRNFHTADLPQQHGCKQKEAPADQQLLKQELDVDLDQEQVHIGPGGEQLFLKDETDSVVQCKSESEDMLTGFETSSVQYEEEADDQLELLNIGSKAPVRFHRTASQCCTQWTTSSSPVLEMVTSSFPDLSRCDSDDAIVQDEDYSPPSKQQKIRRMDKPAKHLVELALAKKLGGDQIMKEYVQTDGLTDSSRRKLVNIVTAEMTDIHGTAPPRRVREMYAQGIIEMFPSLRDPYSKNGYEHFYDAESGSGYLAWRLKTIQRKSTASESRGSSCQLTADGPTARRDASYIPEVNPSAFMKSSIIPPARESIRVYDETGTEVDADIFEEVVRQPGAGVFTVSFDNASQCCNQGTTSSSPVLEMVTSSFPELSRCDSDDAIVQDEGYSPPSKQQKIRRMDKPAKHLVELALAKKPGGDQIMKEYVQTDGLTDSSRRKLVKILTADMTDIHGTAPPRRVREMYAQGIVEMFPSLRDPYSKNGYEHFYDAESGSGYLAWRLKTIQRKSTASESRGPSCPLTGGGPTARRDASYSPDVTPTDEQCKEAISSMKYSADEAAVKHKMKMTFEYRRKMVLDTENASHVLAEFPRFKDVKGLIEQDFILEFGEDTASRFLERWPTVFRQRVIQQSRTLPASGDLEELICCAEGALRREREETRASGWDGDLASILLLLHLIPPSCRGRKRPGRVSASQAEKHLVVFLKSGSSIQEHVDSISTATQPYLLAVGTKRSSIHQFFIVLDKRAIPCRSTSSLGAFDELFKAHFVFGSVYNQMLHNMYTFIQTTVYNIDVGRVQETPALQRSGPDS